MRHSKFFPGAPKLAILRSLYKREKAYFLITDIGLFSYGKVSHALKISCAFLSPFPQFHLSIPSIVIAIASSSLKSLTIVNCK